MDYSINKEFPLTDAQNEIIDFMRKRPQSINAAGTGMGKTLVTCTLAVHFMTKHPEYKCIILCPNKANKAFKREIEEKLHEQASLFTADYVDRKLNSRFFIFNYSSMDKFYDEIYRIRGNGGVFFILDEAHNLQNPKSAMYQTAKKILGLGRIRWALTATPLGNDLEGMYWMVDLISPGFFGSIDWYKARYIKWEKRKMRIRGQTRMIPQAVGYQHLDELNLLMKQICIIKKRPFKLNFIYRKCQTEPEILAIYKKCAQGLEYMKVDKVSGDTVSSKREWGARLHDLQKCLDNCHPDLEGVTFSKKEKEMCKVILENNARNESTLIYCEYYDTIDRVLYVINKLKVKLGVTGIFQITGKQKNDERAKVEDQLSPRSVVVVSKAGTESLNLQKANNVIFYDIPFAINDVIQMVGRVARMDSKFAEMNIYFLEYEDTLDTYKCKLIQGHSTLIDSVLCHDTNLPTEILVLDQNTIKDMKMQFVWKFKKKKSS